MKNIREFAQTVVSDTAPVNHHTDEDWQILQAVAAVTLPWGKELGAVYVDTLFNTPQLAEMLKGKNRSDQGGSFIVWYEKLVSGVPGEAFWAETCLVGMYHAAAHVNNRHVIAMASRIEEVFFQRCLEAFDSDQAAKVFFAFKRIFGLAIGVMVDSYMHSLLRGMSEIGINERLVARIRNVAVRRFIDEARAVLPLIDWNQGLSVGVDSVDEQHKKLIEILNALHSTASAKSGDPALRKILAELVDYTVHHFTFEEGLMEEHGYPDLENHKKAHVALVDQVAKFNDEFQSGKSKLTGELFQFLRSWLNGHIRGTDKRYTSFFKDKGVN